MCSYSLIRKLKENGIPDQSTIEEMKKFSIKELYDNIDYPLADRRTAAIRILSWSVFGHKNRNKNKKERKFFIDLILKRLTIEYKRYTKLEICNTLEIAGKEAAMEMVNYLGKIRKRQYEIVPVLATRKRGYPPPRDIIACTMAKMYPSAATILANAIENWERVKSLEAIDAYGFMAFHHSELNTEENCNIIYNVIENNKNDDLVIWKCVLCLSAFPSTESAKLLKKIKEEHRYQVIRAEAVRSLKIVEDKNNFIKYKK